MVADGYIEQQVANPLITLLKILSSEEEIKCPKCGSKNVSVGIHISFTEGKTYLDIFCLDCRYLKKIPIEEARKERLFSPLEGGRVYEK